MQSLIKELEKQKSSLLHISEQLQPIAAVLSPDQHPSLRDLLSHVENNTQSLIQIEAGLKAVTVNLKSGLVDALEKGDDLQDDLKVSGQGASSGHNSPDGVRQTTRTPYDTLDGVATPLVEYNQVGMKIHKVELPDLKIFFLIAGSVPATRCRNTRPH